MDNKKQILQQTKDLYVYMGVCEREKEFGSVSYIVSNVTRKNNDFKKCSKLLHYCDADCCCIY